MSQIRITDGKGVHFTFDNGITISIQLGGGNYSDNYNEPIGRSRDGNAYQLPPSSTAEIAVWNAKNDWIEFECDTVKGYVPVNDVLRFVDFLKSLPDDLEKHEIEFATNNFKWGEKVAA